MDHLLSARKGLNLTAEISLCGPQPQAGACRASSQLLRYFFRRVDKTIELYKPVYHTSSLTWSADHGEQVDQQHTVKTTTFECGKVGSQFSLRFSPPFLNASGDDTLLTGWHA